MKAPDGVVHAGWERIEAPLVELDEAFAAFASRHGMSLRRNYHDWPERSVIQEGEVTRLIQVYLDDEARLTFSVWLCASQDRGDERFWKSDYLARGVSAGVLAANLHIWLEQGWARLQGWNANDLVFATRLGQVPEQADGAYAALSAGAAQGSGVRRPSVPWSTRDVWFGVLMGVVLLGVAYALLFSLGPLSLRIGVDLWVAIIPTLLELLFLIPVGWFAVRKYRASPRTLGFVNFKFSVLAVGLGLLVAFYIFNAFYASLLDGFGLHVQTDLTPVLRRLSTPWPLVATTVIVAPFVEETFFRGFVFAGLRSRYDWRWAAAISAALFAGAHLSLTFFIPAFLLGFAFAYLYQRSNSIWPGMAIHFVLNALAMTVLYVSM